MIYSSGVEYCLFCIWAIPEPLVWINESAPHFLLFMDTTTNKEQWARLAVVIAYSQMTTNAFARYIGLPCGENLYRIKRGQNGISRDVANRIAKKFPEISLGWLLCGEGVMLLD